MSIEDQWHGARTGPGKRWAVRWREPGGKQHRDRFDKRGEAERFEAWTKLSPEVRAEREGRQLSVERMMGTWLATKRDKRPQTLDAYHYDAREVTDWFGSKLAATVQPSEVRLWVARDRGVSFRRRSLVALSQAYKIAMADGLLTRNPCTGIEPPKASRKPPRVLTWDALGALAREAGEWAPLIWLLGTTGLRVGEAAGLRVGDIDVERGRILVRQSVTYASTGAVVGAPKSGKGREVPVTLGVLDLLPLADRDPGAWLWVGARGDRLHVPSWRRRVFQPAAARAGLGSITVSVVDGKRHRSYTGIGIHTLRHTAASIAIADGADVVSVQAMLGHANLTTTQIYSHPFETAIDDVARRMQRRMDPQPQIEIGAT